MFVSYQISDNFVIIQSLPKKGVAITMRKKIALYFLMAVSLIAQDVDSYQMGLDAYKSGSYKKSYNAWKGEYLQHLDDAKFNFMFGRAAYESGHYAMALAAFERVAMHSPHNLRNTLEMGKTYYMLKMYEDAAVAFEEVLENPNLPQEIRLNVELLLSRVSKVQQKSFTYARVQGNYFYDSNVNYGTLGDIQYGGNLLPQVESYSDHGLELTGSFVNIYDIGQKNGFAIKNNVTGYIKDYNQRDLYDVQYLSYAPSLLYSQHKYVLEMATGIDILRFGKRSLLRSFFVTPKVQFKHTDTLKSFIALGYQYKDFIPEAQKILSARHYDGSYALQKILTPHSYTQLDGIVTLERKVRGDNTNVSFNEYKARIVYADQFSSRYGVECLAHLKKRDYRDFSVGFNSTRKDLGGYAKIDFSIRILQTLRLNLKGSYEYIDSNQDKYSYKKYILAAGFTKTF